MAMFFPFDTKVSGVVSCLHYLQIELPLCYQSTLRLLNQSDEEFVTEIGLEFPRIISETLPIEELHVLYFSSTRLI